MANQFRKIIGCNIRLQPDYPQTAKLVIPSEALGVSGCIRRPRGAHGAKFGVAAGCRHRILAIVRSCHARRRSLATLGELSTTCARTRGGDSRSLTSSPIVASVSGHCTSISGSSWRFPRWNTGGGTAWPQLGRFLKATSDTSVTEVATRFGFSHFGRFSQQYRRCFDETPSETLQRNRIAQEKRTAPAGGDGANASGAVGVATRVWRERPSVTVDAISRR
jgi:AraC-like DNA-binding protein